jgi:NADH-quinone oxidoreductase subunit J
MLHALDAILGPAYFWLFASVAMLCGLGLLLSRHPINGAVYLIGVMLSLSGIYALLHSPFLAVLQVLVYAGAIMMLVVFVIMVLNQAKEHQIPVFDWFSLAGLILPIVLGGALVLTVGAVKPTFQLDDKNKLIVSPILDQTDLSVQFTAQDAGEGASYAWALGDGTIYSGRETTHTYSKSGTYQVTLTVTKANKESTTAAVRFRAHQVPRGEVAILAATMFNSSRSGLGYYLLFELIGVLLLAAVVGAVVLAKRNLDSVPPPTATTEEGHH